MRGHVLLFLLFVFLILLFTSTFVNPSQESDDSSYETTSSALSRPNKQKCPLIRDSIVNGWGRLRNRGRITKFNCNSNFQLIGNRIITCIQGKWNYPTPVCVARGCPKIYPKPPNKVSQLFRGSVLEFSCDLGYEFSTTSLASYRLYCDSTQWRTFESNERILDSNHLPNECKMRDINALKSCDFEASFCGWMQDNSDDFDWLRNQKATPSGSVNTGPTFDHTLGPGKSGFYAYIETSAPRKTGDIARLYSPVYSPDQSNSCFIFHYHMFGKTIGSLKVYIKQETQVFSELHPFWMRFGDAGNQWIQQTVSVPAMSQPFQIVIEAVRGSSYVGDTGIDDLVLTHHSLCHNSTSALTTKESNQWSLPTPPIPQLQIATQYETNTETTFITNDDFLTIRPLNTGMEAKSQTTTNSKFDSKISTTTTPMNTLFTSSVINMKGFSNESQTIFADYSKTSQSIPITADMDKSNAFTTNQSSEMTQLTTTTSALFNTIPNPFSSTEPIVETELTSLSTNTFDVLINSTKIMNNLSTKVRHDMSANERPGMSSNVTEPSVPTTALSYSSESTSTQISYTKQKSPINVLTTSAANFTHIASDGLTVRSTQDVMHDIIESKTSLTTDVKPITSDTSVRRSNTQQINAWTQAIQTNVLRSRATNGPITRPTTPSTKGMIESNQNVKNNFKTNTNPKISIQTQKLIPETTPSLPVPMNGTVFAGNSTHRTTITPIVITTGWRRRRQFGTKTRIAFNSAVSHLDDNKSNTSSVMSISVTIILMSLIVSTLSLYYVHKHRNRRQNRLPEDSEMRYLSPN